MTSFFLSLFSRSFYFSKFTARRYYFFFVVHKKNCHWFIILLHASNYWRIFLSFTDSINGLLNPWVNKLTWELISRRFIVITDADRPYPINITRSINHKRRIYCAKNSKIVFDPTAARWRLNRMCETFLVYSHVVERSQKLKKYSGERENQRVKGRVFLSRNFPPTATTCESDERKSLVRAL